MQTLDVRLSQERPASAELETAGRALPYEEPFRDRRFWELLAAHRVLVFVVIGLSFASLPHENNLWNRWYDAASGAEAWRAAFANWDGQHYLLLASQGYASTAEHHHAFYPLFPWMLAAATFCVRDAYVAGWIVVGVCTALFARYFLLYGEAVLDKQRAFVALALVFAHPAAFFMGVLYSEALFLALLCAWLWYYHREHWAALAPALLMPLARGQALFVLAGLVAALGWRTLSARRWPKLFELLNVFALMLGTAGYFFFMHLTLDDALAGIRAQATFASQNSARNLLNPVHFLQYLQTPPEGWFSFRHGLVDKIAVGVMLSAAVVVARLRSALPLLLYLALAYCPAAMGSGTSYLRYSLIAMPFLALGLAQRMDSPQRQHVLEALVVSGAALQILLAGRFALNVWAG